MARSVSRRSAWVWLLALTALGTFLRTWGLASRPFWRDEAWLADVVRSSSFAELLRGVEAPAPPLFAIIAKFCGSLVAPAELALRLPSALCGIALIPLSFLAARALRMPRGFAMAGATLCALSTMLVIWSRELKQYQAEAFLAVLIAWLVFRIRRAAPVRRPSATDIVLLPAVALVAPWIGYGSSFVAAALPVLLIFPWRRRVGLIGIATCAAVLLSVALLYLGAGGRHASDPALVAYMSQWFIDPTSPADWARAGGLTATGLSMLFIPFEWMTNVYARCMVAAPIVFVAMIGLVTCPRRTRLGAAWWLIGPWVFLIAAAVLRIYPYGVVRMMVFLSPPVILLTAVGIVRIARELTLLIVGRGELGIRIGVLVAFVPLVYVVQIPINHRYWVFHDFPTILREVEQRRLPNEPVFVSQKAVPCVRYYADSLDGFVMTPLRAGTLADRDLDYPAWYRARLAAGADRWWLIRTGEPVNAALGNLIDEQGYEAELAVQAGPDSRFGNARLYLVTRKSRR